MLLANVLNTVHCIPIVYVSHSAQVAPRGRGLGRDAEGAVMLDGGGQPHLGISPSVVPAPNVIGDIVFHTQNCVS